MSMTNTKELSPMSTRSLRFFWSEREDGAEVFGCRHADGSLTQILSPEELETAEELIAALAS
jgi:hypothetical protein